MTDFRFFLIPLPWAPPKITDPSLHIGGCDLNGLAAEFGTPLYIYDQQTIDGAVQAYRDALSRHYPGPAGITYAGKACMNVTIARLMAAHGLLLDCTGIGELHIARAAGVPRAQILMHGVNKSQADLQAGLAQAGTLVVDNLPELERIAQLAGGGGRDAGTVAAGTAWLRGRHASFPSDGAA